MDFPDTTAAENYRRRQALAMTPEQRLELGAELNRQAWELLQANPAAYEAFLKRNFRLRRRRENKSSHEQ
ncbi:hypothetical protein [Stieleria varia]|uniref:Uncharacterized protein n=1 Tax=Stieleria varia TaxID=2528005 RepID=A0A5C6ALA6_9BACT|nr:hypothetical protein [Stieleria varia]TWU00815.1 hypothetical protein Pla52n_41840 [Stieleria varia]